jgi:putative endonuclease
MRMNARGKLGRVGEERAARYYREHGFRVLERNHRRPEGEIDLVVRRGRLLVFCEVKTRSSDKWGIPAEAVTPVKQLRLRRLAAGWMSDNHPGRVEVRFDVISALVGTREIELHHLPDAF